MLKQIFLSIVIGVVFYLLTIYIVMPLIGVHQHSSGTCNSDGKRSRQLEVKFSVVPTEIRQVE
jgi:hypothetical protein